LISPLSPAGLLGRGIRAFGLAGKKYGAEWYIFVVGLVIVAFVILMTLMPWLLTSFNPSNQDAGPQLAPPDGRHLMGTDNLGRDIWSRVVWGSQTVLGVAFAAALISSVVGIPLGLLSGFAGGAVDRVLALIMDAVYSFPGLVLAIAFAAMLGPGVVNITVAVSVIYIPTYFRLVRGQTIGIREELYVEAARVLGARRWTILGRYVFPNVIATTAVVFSVNIADAIMTEAALSYLGLGLPAGIPDWGMDLSMGKKFLPSGDWWLITFPGLMIMLLALGFSFVGEGLAEILNPKLLEK
jgi:peptide/nickel transport system permease protein